MMRRPAPATVLVVGEALADVVLGPGGRQRAHPGGSPANVALGLARLGRAVHLATRIGRDEYGQLLQNHLEGSGVRLTPGSVDDAPTSTATARLDEDGSASYCFDLVWDPPRLRPPAGMGHLHIGSVAATLAPGAARVGALVGASRTECTVSYDPNLRPALLGPPGHERPRVERLVADADVVKASAEDLCWLYPGREPEAVAVDWARSGPALVVLTRGSQGADAYWGADGRQSVAARPVQVADTIGAGDAFMAGLLAGLLTAGLLGGERPSSARARLRTATRSRAPHPEVTAALDLATRAAALTCSRAGADLPTLAETRA